jgi:replicative DNA helicase
MNDQFSQLPPHSIPSEMCVIASMMIDPQAITEVRAIITRDAFYQPDHQILFDTIIRLTDSGRPVDAVLLREELLRTGRLEEIGGSSYLGDVLNSVPSSAHAVHYAGVVREAYIWRQCIQSANDLLRAAYGTHHEDDTAAKVAMDAAANLSQIGAGGSGERFRHISELVHEVLERISTGQQRAEFIPTGFRDLDASIGGLRRGAFTMVGGRPGMGKSQFLKAIGQHAASNGFTVCHITIEEDLGKVASNMLSTMSGVENMKLAFGEGLHEHDYRMINAAQERFARMNYYADDRPTRLSEVVSAVMAAKARYGADVVTVDYLQLINPESKGYANQDRELTQISNGLKMAFKRARVAGCVAAQLNRGNESERIPPAPTMRNLRGSGSLEQDGDVILMLHSTDYYKRISGETFTPNHQLQVVIGKNKNGPGGTIPLFQDHRNQLLRNWEHSDGPVQQDGGDHVPEFP